MAPTASHAAAVGTAARMAAVRRAGPTLPRASGTTAAASALPLSRLNKKEKAFGAPLFLSAPFRYSPLERVITVGNGGAGMRNAEGGMVKAECGRRNAEEKNEACLRHMKHG